MVVWVHICGLYVNTLWAGTLLITETARAFTRFSKVPPCVLNVSNVRTRVPRSCVRLNPHIADWNLSYYHYYQYAHMLTWLIHALIMLTCSHWMQFPLIHLLTTCKWLTVASMIRSIVFWFHSIANHAGNADIMYSHSRMWCAVVSIMDMPVIKLICASDCALVFIKRGLTSSPCWIVEWCNPRVDFSWFWSMWFSGRFLCRSQSARLRALWTAVLMKYAGTMLFDTPQKK